MKIYDKIDWHLPTKGETPSLEQIKLHFKIVMQWLFAHNFLNDEGLGDLETEWGPDFSITDEQLTPEGIDFMDAIYSDWLATINYEEKPSIEILDEYLEWTR